MDTRYLIIGAGLAGCTCGFLLKQAGADVLLVERQDLSRKSKLCAGLVTPRAQAELRKVYGPSVESVYRQTLDVMRAVTDEIHVDVHGMATKSAHRADLDAYALRRYRDVGGKAVDRVAIRNIDFANRMVTGFHDHAPFSCSYGTLIGADGARSFVRQAATGSRPDAILTLEAQVENNGSPYTMAFNDGFFGYSWYAPQGDFAKVGCGSFTKGRVDLRGQLDRFAGSLGVDVGRVRGAFIPTGGDVLLEDGRGTRFLGDAASLVCPPSGEGIYFAVHSARQLARALLAHASYRALMAPEAAEIAREYRTRDLFFNRTFMRAGLALADATPYGMERAVKFALRHFVSFW